MNPGLNAFRDLTLSREHDAIGVSDIVDRANVGRSTFYEHYESKDDLYRQSLAGIVTPLADAVLPDPTGSGWKWSYSISGSGATRWR